MKPILKTILLIVCLIDLVVWWSRIKTYKNLDFEGKSRFVGNVIADFLILGIYIL